MSAVCEGLVICRAKVERKKYICEEFQVKYYYFSKVFGASEDYCCHNLKGSFRNQFEHNLILVLPVYYINKQGMH